MERDFPIDWTEWRAEWNRWSAAYGLKITRSQFPPKNLLADKVIGVYRIGGHDAELSEVTFPGFGSGQDPNRYIGITWLADDGSTVNGGLVETFDELEEALAAGRPIEDVA